MKAASALDELIDALRCLPSVGPRSAQRMAYHLLQHDQDGAQRLAAALGRALSRIRRCSRCNTFTEEELCGLCASPKRDVRLLCVVEMPADLRAQVTLGSPEHFRVLMARHGRGINIAFADGSARWTPLEELYMISWQNSWTPYRLKLPAK